MISQAPELERHLRREPCTSGDRRRKEVARRIEDAFVVFDAPWRAASAIAYRLEKIADEAGRELAEGDAESAVWALSRLASETMSAYEHGYDHEGELTHVLSRICESLGAAFGSLPGQRRSDSIDLLLDLLTWDVRQGGIMDFGKSAERLLEGMNDAERRAAVTRARQEMKGLPRGKWAYEEWGRRSIQWQAKDIDDEQYLDLCRETGNRELLLKRLLDLGRHEDALEALRAAMHYQLLDLADLFRESGRGDLAETAVIERATKHPDRIDLIEWLFRRAEEVSDDEAKREYALSLCRLMPTTENFHRWLPVANDGDADELAKNLREQGKHLGEMTLLIELDRLDEARDAFLRIERAHEKTTARIRLAKALSGVAPHEAAELFAELAETEVALRGRNNYRVAVDWLREARSTLLAAQQEDAWQGILSRIEASNARLPAFRDELNLAGLRSEESFR